jgi:DNA-binding transcriptional ArsR family regulator
MQVLAALADPTRRRIVELLANGEMAAGEVAGHFILSRAAVSQHLQHLLDAGLVRVRTVGQRRIYSFNLTGLNELESWLQQWRSRAVASARRVPGARVEPSGGPTSVAVASAREDDGVPDRPEAARRT